MNSTEGKREHVFGLDVPRAVAILLVLLSHTWPSSKCGVRWAAACGILGVEIFFVLSGFLIGGILIRLADEGRLATVEGLGNFWRRRWLRTLPAYYLFLGLHIFWGWFSLNGSGTVSVDRGIELALYLSSYREFFVFTQNLFHPTNFFFPETWSLAVEEWFYLLFPLVLWLGLKISASTVKVWFAVIGFFLLAPAFGRLILYLGWPVGDYGDWEGTVRSTVVYRLDTIVYGVASAFLASRCPELWRKAQRLWPLAVALLGLYLVSLACDTPLNRYVPTQWMLMWPLMAISIALSFPALSNWRAQGGAIGTVVTFIARISYSLYLSHGLIIIVLGTWSGPRSPLALNRHTPSWMAVVWLLSFLVATASYRWFEKPIMNARPRQPDEKPRREK